MASKITKTKPMSKSKNSALATMRAQAETHQAQILAFKHGILWAVAESVWNKFADNEFDNNEIGHWQGAGYRAVKEIATAGAQLIKEIPTLAVKHIGALMSGSAKTIMPPV